MGALTEFSELAITVRVKGVASLLLPTASVSPAGIVANERLTVFGSRVTLVELLSPPLSVAWRWSSRYDG